MAHAYTPGLRVTPCARLRRERRLPLKGSVLVGVGQEVSAATPVARVEVAGSIHAVNLAAQLSVDPDATPGTLIKWLGARVEQGEVVARSLSLFGLLRHEVRSPASGRLESLSRQTGQLVIREPSAPVVVKAYVRGRVAAVLPEEGVTVETVAALAQGIFGVGGEATGRLHVAVAGPDDELRPEVLASDLRGHVVVGGAYASLAALQEARQLGVAAVVVGGVDDRDLAALVGRDLGVAVTGAEQIGLTVILTEGFGRLRMAERAWRLLAGHHGREASVSGATQIRAGVQRPEVLVPLDGAPPSTAMEEGPREGLALGSLLRVIRSPYFGRLGRAVALPVELRPLETQALARVVQVEFADDGSRAWVARANVELLEE
jgi:hypothetical protein